MTLLPPEPAILQHFSVGSLCQQKFSLKRSAQIAPAIVLVSLKEGLHPNRRLPARLGFLHPLSF